MSVTMLVGVVTVGTPVAAATAPGYGSRVPAGAATTSAAMDPVGTYDVRYSDGTTGALTLRADGSFTSSAGETGVWTTLSDAVALNGLGPQGCLWLATMTTTGLNSKRRPGPRNCEGTRSTWYALTSAAPAPSSSRGQRASDSAVTSRASGLAGMWDITNDLPDSGVLTLKHDGIAVQEYEGSDYVGGFWVTRGQAVAFNVTNSQFGNYAFCLFLGIGGHGAIGSASDPGIVDCGDGPFSWYAARARR